jgi:hypothetical protein
MITRYVESNFWSNIETTKHTKGGSISNDIEQQQTQQTLVAMHKRETKTLSAHERN